MSVEDKCKMNCSEPDDFAQAVGATILRCSSDSELFVIDSTNIELSEDNEMNNHGTVFF